MGAQLQSSHPNIKVTTALNDSLHPTLHSSLNVGHFPLSILLAANDNSKLLPSCVWWYIYYCACIMQNKGPAPCGVKLRAGRREIKTMRLICLCRASVLLRGRRQSGSKRCHTAKSLSPELGIYIYYV